MEKGLDGGSNGLLRGEKGATWEGGLRCVLAKASVPYRVLVMCVVECGVVRLNVWCYGVMVLWCDVSYGVGCVVRWDGVVFCAVM